MLKANLTAPYTIQLQEADVPKIRDTEVLLKVLYTGICGSDIQMYHGKHKYMTFPVVFGHELSAYVVKMGSAVDNFSCGDLVTVEPQVTCGRCHSCMTGHFNVCENLKVLGVHADGFMAQYVAVESSYLHKCDIGMDPRKAALIEPLAVAVGAVRRAGFCADANVLVIGAGTIGNLIAQAAITHGAGKVMVSDINPIKLDTARKCGIDLTVNAASESLADSITNHFGQRRADIIIDTAASRVSFKSMLAVARPRSTIVITGNYKEPVELAMPIIQRQEIDILGHMMYVREDFSEAITWIEQGKIQLDEIITATYSFSRLTGAFAFIDNHPDNFMKILINVQNSEE